MQIILTNASWNGNTPTLTVLTTHKQTKNGWGRGGFDLLV